MPVNFNAITPEIEEVWRHKQTGKKFVVYSDKIQAILDDPNSYEFIADRPHGDKDFSYLCRFLNCRCMQ